MPTIEVPSRAVTRSERWQALRWWWKLKRSLWRARLLGPAPTEQTIHRGRQEFEGVGRYLGQPAGCTITDDDADGVPVQWLDFSDEDDDAPVVFYVHGGAYAMGSIIASRHAAAVHARRIRARCLVVEYRLAPEDPYPAGLDDLEAAIRWLYRQADPSHVVALAESAGAGLLLGLLARLRDQGEPMPAAAVTISAWANLAMDTPSYVERRRRDLALDTRLLRIAADLYTQGADPTDPEVSPVRADLTGFPRLLVAVGENEVVWDDSTTIHDHAVAAGVEATLLIGRDQIHCWPGYADHLPAAAEAADHIAAFVRDAIRPLPRD